MFDLELPNYKPTHPISIHVRQPFADRVHPDEVGRCLQMAFGYFISFSGRSTK
jgi:hypothetical protein